MCPPTYRIELLLRGVWAVSPPLMPLQSSSTWYSLWPRPWCTEENNKEILHAIRVAMSALLLATRKHAQTWTQCRQQPLGCSSRSTAAFKLVVTVPQQSIQYRRLWEEKESTNACVHVYRHGPALRRGRNKSRPDRKCWRAARTPPH